MNISKLSKKVRVVWKTDDPIVLIKKALRLSIEEVVGHYYKSDLPLNPRPDELPTVIEVASTDLNWKSTFSKHQFPTKDKTVDKPGVFYDQPFFGILGGPWDRFKTRWDHSTHHQSLLDHFYAGIPWEETDLYTSNEAKLAVGSTGQSGVTTIEELEERCQELDRLYESMSKHGYIPQSKISNNKSITANSSVIYIDASAYPDECRIGIGRGGELIRFSGGRHRFSIAKLLELNDIPVVVVVRHKRWQTIREAFQDAEYISNVPEKYREYADHPDIQEFI